MDKRLRIIWMIRVILTLLLIGFILGVWPGYLVHDLYVSRTMSELYESTEVLAPRSVVTQYFVPQRGHLSAIEFAVLFDKTKVKGETLRFSIYNEAGEEIFSQDIKLERMKSESYYKVHIDGKLNAGETYCWVIECPDAGDIGLKAMYTNHLANQAPENALFLLDNEKYGDYGDITKSISQYTYLIHPDKIEIIGEYWAGAVLAYIICMDILSRFSGDGNDRTAGRLKRKHVRA